MHVVPTLLVFVPSSCVPSMFHELNLLFQTIISHLSITPIIILTISSLLFSPILISLFQTFACLPPGVRAFVPNRPCLCSNLSAHQGLCTACVDLSELLSSGFERVREGSRRFEKVREGLRSFERVRESSKGFEKVREGSRRFVRVREGSRKFEKVREGFERI